MKIIVLNGSPKGSQSITLQHIRFLESQLPGIESEVFPISKSIRKYEQDPELFDQLVEKMKTADAVLWSFPVYYALVPGQMKRFIELLFERRGAGYFAGRYTTSLTTSINFFDHTAHNYLQGVCEALGFSYVKGYSAHMDDFFQQTERQKLVGFYSWFVKIAQDRLPVPRKYALELPQPAKYDPGPIDERSDDGGQKILLLVDEEDPESNLARMIQVFRRETKLAVEIKSIRESGMKHGCLGCCTCGYENVCVQKDGFSDFFNQNLKKADLILICGRIRDHYFSATWKQFFDRCFFNGHAPVLQGKEVGYIISGPLSRLQNLREMLDILADNWHMKYRGVVTDEAETSAEVTEQIRGFARSLELAREVDLAFGPSFYGIGGEKLFRDFIFNRSAVFKADDQFYKEHQVYDTFPQRALGKRWQNALFSMMVAIPALRKKIHQRFIPGMVAPYKKKLAKLTR